MPEIPGTPAYAEAVAERSALFARGWEALAEVRAGKMTPEAADRITAEGEKRIAELNDILGLKR